VPAHLPEVAVRQLDDRDYAGQHVVADRITSTLDIRPAASQITAARSLSSRRPTTDALWAGHSWSYGQVTPVVETHQLAPESDVHHPCRAVALLRDDCFSLPSVFWPRNRLVILGSIEQFGLIPCRMFRFSRVRVSKLSPMATALWSPPRYDAFRQARPCSKLTPHTSDRFTLSSR
jgi:hypothetical protein